VKPVDILGTDRPLSSIGDMATAFCQSYTDLLAGFDAPLSPSAIRFFWRFHGSTLLRLKPHVSDLLLPTHLFGLGLPLEFSSIIDLTIPDVFTVKRGLAARRLRPPRQTSVASVLPRRPRGAPEMVQSSSRSTCSVACSSAYVNFCRLSDSLMRSWTLAPGSSLLRQLSPREIGSVRIAPHHLSDWDNFVRLLCADPDRMSDLRLEFLERPTPLVFF
jgi:hypothetical protein